MTSPIPWMRSLRAFAALAVVLLLWADDASARNEGGAVHGKRDANTVMWSPVVAANTTPDRSSAEPPAHAGGSLGGLFNRRGLLGGFAAGFLGAGLLGFAFGHGLFGGLGSTASFLGLIFQLTLVAMLARLIWKWWSGRNAPAFSGLSPRQLADPYLRSRGDVHPGVEAPGGAEAASLDGEPIAARPAAVVNSTVPAVRG